MGQDELLFWLAKKRKAGNNQFFGVDYIQKNFGCGRSVWKLLARLNNWGYLDLKIEFKPRYKRYFRIKSVHVKPVLDNFKSTKEFVGTQSMANDTNIYS